MFPSLRGKLIAATLLIQILMIALLAWNGQRLIEMRLLDQFEQRIRTLTPLLSAALITPMIQRDYAVAAETLNAMQAHDDFSYLVLSDANGKHFAANRWLIGEPLPPPSPPLSLETARQLDRYDARIAIAYAGQHYGELAYGLKLDFLRRALREHLLQSISIAFFGTLAASLLLVAISLWLTRHLKRLTLASEALAAGQPHQPLAIASHDEIGKLACSFESMANALGARLAEREAVEQHLKHALQSAEAANRAKSQFLASMSHELRTPMNGVLGMTQLLATTPLTAEQRDYAEQIRLSTADLLRVINDLLDMATLETGGIELNAVDFDLADWLDANLAPLAAQAQAKGLLFHQSIDPALPSRLRGDPRRLGQVLVNLVGNAIKFTPSGKVSVRLSAAPGTHQPVLRGEIRDSGIGIASARLPDLFVPFHQIDASTTRRYGGTGLGLSIAKRLIEMMGGTIGVDSTEDVGTTFWFTCPCAAVVTTNQVPTSTAAASFNAAVMLAHLGNDRALAQMVIESLIADLPERVASLNAAAAAKDLATARREAHTIKGLADTGGNAALRQAALDIQLLCEQENLADAVAKLAHLPPLLAQALDEWRGYLAQHDEKVGAGDTAPA